MGNHQSSIYHYQKLCQILPSVDKKGWENPATGWFDKSAKPFASEKDRDQFIYATITVLSQNGSIDLNHHEFRLFYSRRENDQMVARIVAERSGVIIAQVEPAEDGKDQAEAFKALRRHVELQLDRILQNVPGASMLGKPESGVVGPSRVASGSVGPASPGIESQRSPTMGMPSSRNRVPQEAPPAYGRAVKEWRAQDDSNKA